MGRNGSHDPKWARNFVEVLMGFFRDFLSRRKRIPLDVGKNFIANASHELRTPLTIIRGFVEMLADFPKLSPEQRKGIVKKILKTCDRLERLVQGLLRLADLETPSKRRGEMVTDLSALVENTRDELLLLYPHARITLEKTGKSHQVEADSDLIMLAISNLLENSVKYAKETPQIALSLREREGEVELCIADQGIGIPKEDLPYIFDRFYTVDKARSRKLGGAGLGLSIVKAVVENQKGAVSVCSELGKGTTFTLHLKKSASK